MTTLFLLALAGFLIYLIIQSVREGLTLARQPDMNAYIASHYEPRPANGGPVFRIYGPSPAALLIAKWLKS